MEDILIALIDWMIPVVVFVVAVVAEIATRSGRDGFEIMSLGVPAGEVGVWIIDRSRLCFGFGGRNNTAAFSSWLVRRCCLT